MSNQYKKRPDEKIYYPEQFNASNPEAARGVCGCKAWGVWHVHTMHEGQIVELADKDWIMPEPVADRFYPIKPEVFDKTYYRVD